MKHIEMIMVIEAHSEGKAIQCSADHSPNDWHDVAMTTLKFNFSDYSYRVKPVPKYDARNFSEWSNGKCIEIEYVEIKALEDAVKLIGGRILGYGEGRIYDELKSLLN